MEHIKRLTTPLSDCIVKKLQAGDLVHINGYIFTSRDAVHKRLIELIKKKQRLPIKLNGQIIYYVGLAPTKPGYVCGSAGPTTSTEWIPIHHLY